MVDDYFDILLFYTNLNVRLKASYFVREMIPSYILQGKKGSFLKPRGDVQEDELKLGKKPNSTDWGKEPEELQGILHTEIEGEIIREKAPTLLGNYTDFFEGLYQSITQNIDEPVTAQDGENVMLIIDKAMESSKLKKIISIH